eukprot:7323912-Prymnesium_polylepis.1
MQSTPDMTSQQEPAGTRKPRLNVCAKGKAKAKEPPIEPASACEEGVVSKGKGKGKAKEVFSILPVSSVQVDGLAGGARQAGSASTATVSSAADSSAAGSSGAAVLGESTEARPRNACCV